MRSWPRASRSPPISASTARRIRCMSASLVQIMLLRWLQKTGHKPIVLMGGGTTKVGDPSGKDESRQLLTDAQIAANMAGIRRVFEQFLDLRQRSDRRGDGRQRRLARPARLHPVPARIRPPFFGQPHARLRFGEAPARARAAADLPRVQLHGAAGLRLPRAGAAPRLRAADGRLGPVGQHRLRRRAGAAHRRPRALRPDHAADHDGVGREDGQDRARRRLAQRRPRVASTSTISSGATPRTPTSAASCELFTELPLAEIAQLAAARRSRDQRGEEDARRSRRRSSCHGARRGATRPPRPRAAPSRRARPPKACPRSRSTRAELESGIAGVRAVSARRAGSV